MGLPFSAHQDGESWPFCLRQAKSRDGGESTVGGCAWLTAAGHLGPRWVVSGDAQAQRRGEPCGQDSTGVYSDGDQPRARRARQAARPEREGALPLRLVNDEKPMKVDVVESKTRHAAARRAVEAL